MSEWVLAYDGFVPEQEGLREALCTLGNGLFATRGAAPEAAADSVHYPGTYVAGLYDRLVSDVAGRTVENEDLVNVPNWLPLRFRPEGGRWFHPGSADLLGYRQELDLRTGTLVRHIRFRDDGRTTRVTQRRIVSMDDPHLAAMETTLVPEDWSGTLEVGSALDGRVANAGVRRYAELRGDHLVPLGAREEGAAVVLEAETRDSHVRIAVTARTRILSEDDEQAARPEPAIRRSEGFVAQDFAVSVRRGRQVRVEKVVALATSLHHAVYEPGTDVVARLDRAASFDALLVRHVMAWDGLWRRFDLEIGAHERPQRILRLHIFHLLQTCSPHTIDRDVGVPARGLHGEAYRGHVFWDELFIFPFLNLRLPALTRSLLRYRVRRLPAARDAARRAGYAGAMFPWQSGSDGREESQQVHLNPRSGRWVPDRSHLQRHINVAIAYNLWKYYQATGDLEFLRTGGAELLAEIARFWGSIATYNRSLDRYEIRGVMGPDEYHDAYPGRDGPGLDNNAYTNVMAAWVLGRALDLFGVLAPFDREALWERLGLRREDVERWEDVSRKMLVPFHGEGIISQFQGYDELQELDWPAYRRRYQDIHRLDRILESEGDSPNRYKVSKQADVLMLFYLLSDDELAGLFHRLGYAFDSESTRRNVEYYLRRTSHGSTLSRIVHSWILARIDPKQSWDLFCEALESDVADIQGGTTPEGIHLGAMAGTVDLAQRCFAGVTATGDAVRIDPILPREVPRLAFTIVYRTQRLRVDATAHRVKVSSEPGPMQAVRVAVGDATSVVAAGESFDVELPRRR